MKKRILALVSVLVLTACMMTACTGNNAGNGSNNGTTQTPGNGGTTNGTGDTTNGTTNGGTTNGTGGTTNGTTGDDTNMVPSTDMNNGGNVSTTPNP